MACRVRSALRGGKNRGTLDYLGCDIVQYKAYMEALFTPGMTWDNMGEWEIDHIIPIKYDNPTEYEEIGRLHYSNTQPMWAAENHAKGNRFIGRPDRADTMGPLVDQLVHDEPLTDEELTALGF